MSIDSTTNARGRVGYFAPISPPCNAQVFWSSAHRGASERGGDRRRAVIDRKWLLRIQWPPSSSLPLGIQGKGPMLYNTVTEHPARGSTDRAKRPWWAFSFRTPLVWAGPAVFFLALILTCFAIDQYRRWGVAHLRSLGAQVSFATKDQCYYVRVIPELDVTSFLSNSRNDLRHLSRFFAISLDLDDTSVSDSDLLLLDSVQGSLYLSLRNTAVTVQGLHFLRRLKNLRSLDVSGCSFPDDALRNLETILTNCHIVVGANEKASRAPGLIVRSVTDDKDPVDRPGNSGPGKAGSRSLAKP